MTIDELIAKLGAAGSGNLALDRAIGVCLAEIGLQKAGTPPEHWRYSPTASAPPYTTSLDAALTLVPEHCDHIEIHFGPPGAWGAEIGHWVLEGDGGPPRDLVDGHALHPALALCIAALRARNAARQDTTG